MGNIVVTNKIVSVSSSNITMSAAVAYPKKNMLFYVNLARQARTTAATTGALCSIDLGSAMAVKAIFLNDVNFNQCQVQGSTVSAWASSDIKYNSGTVTVAIDEVTNRRKLMQVASTWGSRRYLRIFLPAGTVASGVTTAWKISSLVVLTSATGLSKNMAYGYSRRGIKPYRDIALPHGGIRRIKLGENIKWEADVSFGARSTAQEGELWNINAMDNSAPVVFYENNGDTSRAYLCMRSGDYQSEWITKDRVRGNTIRFEELV